MSPITDPRPCWCGSWHWSDCVGQLQYCPRREATRLDIEASAWPKNWWVDSSDGGYIPKHAKAEG